MDENGARKSGVDSRRLRDIENELKSLRGALDRHNHAVNQINLGIAGIQAHLSLLSEAKTRAKDPRRHSKLRLKLEKIGSAAYVYCARIIARADVKDLFDPGYYRSLNPGLTDSGIDPVCHYFRSKSRVSPHWLFDREYYLATYPDVAAAKADPLVHFLRAGWREGRNPHPLFNTGFYLEQVPELRAGKLNPVTHYLQTGWRNNVQPHPLVDGEFYLAKYPDVVGAGMDPMSHYILFGACEGRCPHAWFDNAYYRDTNPDVHKSGANPLRHYLLHGADEGRAPHPLFDSAFYFEQYGPFPAGVSPLEHYVRIGRKKNFSATQNDSVERFLPVEPFAPPVPRNRPVDIVIPAYRGLRETRACIESVLASTNLEPYELIVIDDLSPEPALSEWLREASAGGAFTLLPNEANLGFVATVNRGMSQHADRDVILLNSDTVVANDWLDRLVRCAYQADRVGTVTPLSNNATICSYPVFCEDNPLPPGVNTAQLDQLASQVNQGRSVNIPTAVGFCMYIRRVCLRETGLFDAEVFGKGYGEENDFSLRAASRGWRNLLAADIFVYHSGSVSFAGAAGLLRARSARLLADRHPNYASLVSRHVTLDPAKPYRFALTAARFRASGNPTVLLVSHGLGGGIGQHVEELVESQRESVNFLELQPASGSVFSLSFAHPADGFSVRLDFTRQYDILIKLLRSCNVSRIHIHHVLNHHLSFENLRDDLNVPVVFTVHDYFTICPRIVLADPQGRYCGEPGESGCNACIRETLPHLNLDIASWRAKYAWLINSVDEVIAPSKDAATRMSRYFPAARIEAAAHPLQQRQDELPAVNIPALRPDGVLRIVVLGVMSVHKGLINLQACAAMARDRELPLEFVVAGYTEQQVRHLGPFPFGETGGYSRPDLPSVLTGVDPGLAWFPMRWPETFSYTLSTCLELGLPVMAPRLGALPERLTKRPWTWLYDWETGPEALTELFLGIRASMISGISPPRAPTRPCADPDFYPAGYRAAMMSAPLQVNLRESGRISVMGLLSSYDTGQLQSCAYIRSYLPLTHGQLNRTIRLTVTSPANALAMTSDVLLVQRTAVSSVEIAGKLVRHCSRNGIRIVYETDDDLFQIDETHPENSFYRSRIAPAELIARHATMVLVSSPFLKQRLAHLNSDIRVIPNALDESLWFKAATRGTLKPLRPVSNVVRILYMGSMTHSKDLDLIEEPIRLLKAEFGSSVEFDIVGIAADRYNSGWFNVITVPGICGASYPLFVEWLRAENKWDFAVAPLVDNDFNRCKSYIKYLDYGALRLPGIFSGIGVFEDVVRQGVTGLCIGHETSWYDAMRLLITNKKLRRQMGEAAYLDVEANHTLGSQAVMYRDVWYQIGSLPPVRSSSTIVSFSEETAAISSNGI